MTGTRRGDLDDRMVDVHAGEVPERIRQAVLARMQPGDVLWRCPRRSAREAPWACWASGGETW